MTMSSVVDGFLRYRLKNPFEMGTKSWLSISAHENLSEVSAKTFWVYIFRRTLPQRECFLHRFSAL